MTKKKFWEIKNQVNSKNLNPEILLYGPITCAKSFFGDEVIPQDFVDDLKELDGKNVTVRINSPGGDVFAAHAIHNLLLNHNGKVTCVIDGLAASAATIVAMGGSKIIMPSNSMMMIHNPMVDLGGGYCDAEELSSMAESLCKIKDSIIAAYQKHCKLSAEELADMMSKETWLTAEECLKFGFADKIEGQVPAAINGNNLVINSISYDLGSFKNADLLKNKVEGGKVNMTKLEMILNRLGLFDEVQDVAAPTANAADREQVLSEERARVEALDAIEITNDAVKAIVNRAKANGSTVEDIQEYVDAVKGINLAAQAAFAAQVEDNKNSGVENIAAGIQVAEGNKDEHIVDEKAFGEMFK